MNNSQEIIEDEVSADIVNEGDKYDVIKTKQRQVTVQESPKIETTTYEQSQLNEETHLTFEILGARYNEEKEVWENIVGAQDSYILPDGSFNPNHKKTPEQIREQFYDLQKGIPIEQSKIDEILEPGQSSREQLQGVSKNFSVLTGSEQIQDSQQNDSYNTIEPIQTITVQESSKSISSTDQVTQITQSTSKVSVDIIEENQQDDLSQYLSKQPRKVSPKTLHKSDSKPNSTKESSDSTIEQSPKEDLSQFLSKQPSKLTQKLSKLAKSQPKAEKDTSNQAQKSSQSKPIPAFDTKKEKDSTTQSKTPKKTSKTKRKNFS
ncbi:hypothetical protein HC766_01275 [Candidatus Gracilibacteria bacterium]|nr:hypothetical protein [Candidatus Gracilibacteria bacterium]